MAPTIVTFEYGVFSDSGNHNRAVSFIIGRLHEPPFLLDDKSLNSRVISDTCLFEDDESIYSRRNSCVPGTKNQETTGPRKDTHGPGETWAQDDARETCGWNLHLNIFVGVFPSAYFFNP
ncbi:hypothetical protein TWF970_003847 [Orbilia oligospora]|uniref:Uncharacterized protein n=1 Tax=Orbilia oligospora TaxID=2813651 RepID=A0A7C8VBB6_ORBOL|nr:hypothetical protein TWF970_003847 [Orbilia oligospora]